MHYEMLTKQYLCSFVKRLFLAGWAHCSILRDIGEGTRSSFCLELQNCLFVSFALVFCAKVKYVIGFQRWRYICVAARSVVRLV